MIFDFDEFEEMGDIIHLKDDGLWYFWNESWSEAHGPYSSEHEARKSLVGYMKTGEVVRPDKENSGVQH